MPPPFGPHAGPLTKKKVNLMIRRQLWIIGVALGITLSAPTTLASPTHPLAYFFGALAQRENPDSTALVRVAWWGDSAVAGDGYTHRLRQRLQGKFGDGGAGYILPSPTFGGYVHGQVRLKKNHWKADAVLRNKVPHGRYGLGGILLQSYGGASSTFIARKAGYDKVSVFFHGSPRRGNLQLYVDEEGLPIATHATHRDVAEDARWQVNLGKPSTWIRLRAAGGGLTQVYGVALERQSGGLVLDTLGQVGLRARRLLKMDEAHFIRQVLLRRPNLVAIHFGGNERVDRHLTQEKHQREIEALLQRLKRGALMASCLVVGPLPHGQRRRGSVSLDPRLTLISNAQQAAAVAQGCAYFDTIAQLGGEAGLAHMVKQRLLAKDLAHLTTQGHQRVGDLLADWLLAQYQGFSRHGDDDDDF